MKNEPLLHDDNKRQSEVIVSLPYEIYWEILPELIQYWCECFRRDFSKWADEHFTKIDADTPDKCEAEEKKAGEKDDNV